jgi:hypothetical protein
VTVYAALLLAYVSVIKHMAEKPLELPLPPRKEPQEKWA